MKPSTRGEHYTRLAARYLDAQLRGDRREALRLVDEEGIGAGLSVGEIHLHVITPAQHELGRLWQSNRIHVAQEHAATAISQLVVSHLYRHLAVAAPLGRTVVVACAPGERHELGARMASDFLEAAGFTVRYLGADVPVDELVTEARGVRADLVVLSASTSLCRPGIVDAVRALRAALGELPVFVGGGAFPDPGESPDDCRLPEGVLQAGQTARTLVTRAAARLGVAVPPLTTEDAAAEAMA